VAKLTIKQQRFVDCYDGNATEAAIKAGYNQKYAATNTDKLLKNTNIASAIAEREKERSDKLIATREERQRFWTDFLRDEELDPKDRLKASELLGKSEADFTDKIKRENKTEIDIPGLMQIMDAIEKIAGKSGVETFKTLLIDDDKPKS